MLAHAPRHGAGQPYGPPVTTRPLIPAGRRKTARWACRAVNDTSGPIATAHALHDELAEGVVWPHHVVLRWHLAGYLLPGVAVYRTLQTLGHPARLAAQAVGDLLARDALPRRRRLQRVFRTRGSYPLFAAAVRLLSPIMFPAPGSRIVWLGVSRDRVAFDIGRCYYLAALAALDAAALAPHYCHVITSSTTTSRRPSSGRAPAPWQRAATAATSATCTPGRTRPRPPDPSPIPPRRSSAGTEPVR